MSVELAELQCSVCDTTTEHELHYAGRLLEGVRCTVCGTHLEVASRAMVPAYLADLEQRVASKPRRMARRLAEDPVGFVRALPGALLRQPGKFARELRETLRRP